MLPVLQQLRDWDGRSTTEIETLFDHYHDDPEFARSLVTLLEDQSGHTAALWLIKKGLETDSLQAKPLESRVLAALPSITETNARLLALQILPRLKISARYKHAVEDFVRDAICSEHKFVSAWGYNGFHTLARRFPEYRDEADQLLEMGLRDGTASIKARIRNIDRSWD